MQTFLYNIRQFFSRLPLGQKVALSVMLLGTLAILWGVAYWVGRPDYALLFGGLEMADASRVVESLNERGVSYQLRENGTAVFVPREDVYELRLHFAGEGIISDGAAGYELFDQGTLGMTDFMQKLNMKRALEGELGRTITSIRQVELCRVHLVMPERSPFRQNQVRPSASVVLQVAGGAQLTPSQIEGINALVAGAVEGLAPSDVTILDARGNMLSDPEAGNPDLAAGSNQLRVQQAVEARLTEKGQSMLDMMLGPGNAIVRVAASLDFTRLVSEREVIDPESATVISEERMEEEGDAGALNANSSVRNYELSRTRERSEKSLGDIADLSVSVILNYKEVVVEPPDSLDEAEPEVTFEPYTNAELSEVEALVKNAVGFQEERGDRFAIHQTQFDTSDDTEMAAELRRQRRQEQIRLYIRYGLMVLALILATLLIRSATKRIGTIVQQEEKAVLGGTRPAEQLEGATQGRTGQLARGAEDLELLTSPQREELESMDDTYTSNFSTEAHASLSSDTDGRSEPTHPSSIEEFVPRRDVRAARRNTSRRAARRCYARPYRPTR